VSDPAVTSAHPDNAFVPERALSEGFIYLLHWSHRAGRIEHYIGWTQDLEARMKAHASGSGGCPTTRNYRRAAMRGRLVRLWRGTMVDERTLQHTLTFPVDCPICCGIEVETVRCEGKINPGALR